jgi:hypothetical protein
VISLGVAGCNGSHPAFMSVEPQTVTVEGSKFEVRIKEDWAQVIRKNFEYVPKTGEIFPKAAQAIEIVSGCTVIPNSMKGDAALMNAKVKCDYGS